MKASEIRSKFLKYFEKNDHTIVESSPLIPQNDPTLLFANAGMNQFKDVFLGAEKRPYKRATSSQKCVRAGGKHNDLENVGFTARHHTFFEMLGNFSFGDYFKKEAIHYAWDFIINELKLSKERLYVTVHVDDDEAAEIWEKQEGVPKDRIYRFDDDNFWAMGETGPCGPCTEIFYDRGERFATKEQLAEEKRTGKICFDGDRYIEFWNLVFMQFNRDESGKMSPLPKPSVDTGAGLERIASIIQDVDSNYDTDIFEEIMSKTGELAGRKYSPKSKDAASFRVIADHSRATAFLIADGVLPSNEGRGYVLRRIMRRAIRHGKKLGFDAPFLFKTAGFVVDQMRDAYPYLEEKRSFLEKAIKAEEEQFFKTLERGLSLLDEETAKLKKGQTLDGETAFKLYDTYGFPLDLTRVICDEQGIKVDEKGFDAAMEVQRSTSRKHWKGSGDSGVEHVFQEVAETLRNENKLPEFVGYDSLESESVCTALFVMDGDSWKSAKSSKGSEICRAVFSVTPFYGESGGQVGDQGRVKGKSFEGKVTDVQKPVSDLVVATIEIKSGEITVGEKYTQSVEFPVRALTMRNHTATHLLHWALRDVLGTHVQQAGSLVAPNLLRFDFSHFQAMTPDELKKVEDQVNEKIWSADPVVKKVMSKDEAVKAGAIAFFGEKYGDEVRVISAGDYSVELCGGTHVNNTSEIHLFKIASESGIAAGVRRIIAHTSKGAFDYLRSIEEDFKEVRDQMKASSTKEVSGKIERLMESEKQLRKEIEKLQSQGMGQEIDQLISQAIQIEGGKLIVSLCKPDPNGIKKMREMSDRVKEKSPDSVLILGMQDPEGEKAMLLASVGPKAPKRFHAGNLVKDLAPIIDGRGGGKPDLAQAGGKKPTGLAEMIEKAKSTYSV